MTKIKFLGAAVLLALIASPASAQSHMIDEPGMFAFVYPNGDLGIGTSRPPADAMAMAPRMIMRHPLPARHPKARK
ncbi:MAG: hypothetical protein J0H42_22915 [Rhizobiales bacterium]|nr:hypothetical protein [Hyphomicrobiales bacterium]